MVDTKYKERHGNKNRISPRHVIAITLILAGVTLYMLVVEGKIAMGYTVVGLTLEAVGFAIGITGKNKNNITVTA